MHEISCNLWFIVMVWGSKSPDDFQFYRVVMKISFLESNRKKNSTAGFSLLCILAGLCCILILQSQHSSDSIITSSQHDRKSAPPTTININRAQDNSAAETIYCIPWIEACALITLCSYRSVTKRLSLALLKETKFLYEAFGVQVFICI